MLNAGNSLDKDLLQCQNMAEVLEAVEKHYDLTRPFGIATKLLVITGVKKILDLVKAEPKQKWSK